MLSALKSTFRGIGRQIRVNDDFGPWEDTKARDYAVIGGAAGTVAGATIGTIKGFQSQAENSVKESLVDKDIVHPEMTGYSHRTRVDRDRYCVERDSGRCVDYDSKVEGWWHSYSPNVKDRVVGQYSEPQFQNQNFLEPLTGALLGGLAGGVVGVAAGLGAAALQRSFEKEAEQAVPLPLPRDSKAEAFKGWNSEDKTSKLDTRIGGYAVVGTTLGAGVGIYLGVQAGAAESAANEINTRTWQVPVYESKTIGHIPDGYYEHKDFLQWRPQSGEGRAENVPVNRDVPVKDADGSFKMVEREETFESRRYGKVLGGLAGGVLGAGVGLATGVTVGLADKVLTRSFADN